MSWSMQKVFLHFASVCGREARRKLYRRRSQTDTRWFAAARAMLIDALPWHLLGCAHGTYREGKNGSAAQGTATKPHAGAFGCDAEASFGEIRSPSLCGI